MSQRNPRDDLYNVDEEEEYVFEPRPADAIRERIDPTMMYAVNRAEGDVGAQVGTSGTTVPANDSGQEHPSANGQAGGTGVRSVIQGQRTQEEQAMPRGIRPWSGFSEQQTIRPTTEQRQAGPTGPSTSADGAQSNPAQEQTRRVFMQGAVEGGRNFTATAGDPPPTGHGVDHRTTEEGGSWFTQHRVSERDAVSDDPSTPERGLPFEIIGPLGPEHAHDMGLPENTDEDNGYPVPGEVAYEEMLRHMDPRASDDSSEEGT